MNEVSERNSERNAEFRHGTEKRNVRNYGEIRWDKGVEKADTLMKIRKKYGGAWNHTGEKT